MEKKTTTTTTTVVTTEEVGGHKPLDVYMLLDASGSMKDYQKETVSSVAEYLSALDEKDARITIVAFDADNDKTMRYNVLRERCHIASAKLAYHEYQPVGMTPLNDAAGRMIADIDAHSAGRVAMVIITDGLENSSREYSTNAIKRMLDARQREKGWLVMYLGANQDAFREGEARGTHVHNTANFSMAKMSGALRATAAATKRFGLTGQSVSAAYTDDERKSMED